MSVARTVAHDKQRGNWYHYPCRLCPGNGELEAADGFGKECSVCKGWGSYWIHKPSGVVAAYPGGPFLGRWADWWDFSDIVSQWERRL